MSRQFVVLWCSLAISACSSSGADDPVSSRGGSSPASAGTGGSFTVSPTDGGSSSRGSIGGNTSGGTPSSAGVSGSASQAGAGSSGAPSHFSFFYTSLQGMRTLAKSQNGFGGDLRFGEATGLAGADKICTALAATQGAGGKRWRAFLSVVKGPDGKPVNAIDRVGEGPWYDRRGRVLALNKAGLLDFRPHADELIADDLPDETGEGTKQLGDTHDVITGSNWDGQLDSTDLAGTCRDWTSTATTEQTSIAVGHAWSAPKSGAHWIRSHYVLGCGAGVSLDLDNPNEDFTIIGGGGGWGGFYCFALEP